MREMIVGHQRAFEIPMTNGWRDEDESTRLDERGRFQVRGLYHVIFVMVDQCSE
jgi:hypothetical protein